MDPVDDGGDDDQCCCDSFLQLATFVLILVCLGAVAILVSSLVAVPTGTKGHCSTPVAAPHKFA